MNIKLNNTLKSYFNNTKNLIICFLITPTVIAIIFSILEVYIPSNFKSSTMYSILSNFKEFSSYLYSISSLLLVFILYRKYTHSNYSIDTHRVNYLENQGEEDLLTALNFIYLILAENSEDGIDQKKLKRSCIDIKVILNKISSLEDDFYLKALRKDIEGIVSLIKALKIEHEGLNEINKLRLSNKTGKIQILESALVSVIQDINNKKMIDKGE